MKIIKRYAYILFGAAGAYYLNGQHTDLRVVLFIIILALLVEVKSYRE